MLPTGRKPFINDVNDDVRICYTILAIFPNWNFSIWVYLKEIFCELITIENVNETALKFHFFLVQGNKHLKWKGKHGPN